MVAPYTLCMVDASAAPALAAPLRERRKVKARLDIARVACKLFGENGYDATTVGDIAEAADYSVRSFYRYFATKEHVVFFDIGFMLEDVGQAVAGAPDGASLWTVIGTTSWPASTGSRRPAWTSPPPCCACG